MQAWMHPWVKTFFELVGEWLHLYYHRRNPFLPNLHLMALFCFAIRNSFIKREMASFVLPPSESIRPCSPILDLATCLAVPAYGSHSTHRAADINGQEPSEREPKEERYLLYSIAPHKSEVPLRKRATSGYVSGTEAEATAPTELGPLMHTARSTGQTSRRGPLGAAAVA
jgi:hypothetical protein